MKYTIVDKQDYLRADLLERDNAEETETFLEAIREVGLKHPRNRLLIFVHAPHAFFRIEKYHASRFLAELAERPDWRVALVSVHFEVRILHQYVEALARFKRAKLRSFGDEASAVRWLAEPDSPGMAPSSAPSR
ncbi:MAG TPA: hypothetical protein VM183_05765 [Burkholderiales bacterium]|nr:hypothetical protein [Burkholderiales bacterium]